jgi:8-oxo-dGTP pyrophosphatase MutT (NUDIX family)
MPREPPVTSATLPSIPKSTARHASQVILPPGALNTGPPVEPRPSATVLLIRENDPWELLMVRRPGGADFAPGAYVFPGGSVHHDDAAWPDPIRAAAVRELFEEVGVLLARRGREFARDADSTRVRDALAGGAGFTEALRGATLEPAFDRLVLFERWITPPQLSRRFDARFYFAGMPAGQTVHPQEGEVTDWLWIDPGRALEDPAVTLVYATRAVLESVATGEPAAKLMTRARRRKRVPMIQPQLVEKETGWVIER